ncbi:MAG: hypothetical protein KDB23_25790, partial [Planctomycetales bacterium]|nr:hypothetical protein [Planctomycetales bacterium]
MMRRLIDFCLNEWLVILCFTALAIGFGWHATQVVPLDAIPNVAENQVIVLTEWPGRSPKDMEDQV